MAYKIMGKLISTGYTEEIDSADTLEEAEFMLEEYGVAFGGSHVLWISRESYA